jgi:cytochrome c biogenesis protein CcmG, thiol:disulfide interchange protein DsbE
VNEWESWCLPCHSEFPIFQRVAVQYGKRVAFLGIDAQDHNQAASSWLRSFPVTYPSYTDPHMDIGRSIHAFAYYPQTVFFNARGRMVYQHAGPYLDPKALVRDIRRYALS